MKDRESKEYRVDFNLFSYVTVYVTANSRAEAELAGETKLYDLINEGRVPFEEIAVESIRERTDEVGSSAQ